MKKHSTARRVLALGLNLTLAGVPALLWADEEPTELPALTVSVVFRRRLHQLTGRNARSA
ncbi:hypothetical protein, partial [Pseudomonas aeruginosa]|uniref:hypothetical protein n=1 Tax=Pseudomonas aeruginosa TaxID=287 RepID=UPI0015D4BCF4